MNKYYRVTVAFKGDKLVVAQDCQKAMLEEDSFVLMFKDGTTRKHIVREIDRIGISVHPK